MVLCVHCSSRLASLLHKAPLISLINDFLTAQRIAWITSAYAVSLAIMWYVLGPAIGIPHDLLRSATCYSIVFVLPIIFTKIIAFFYHLDWERWTNSEEGHRKYGEG